MSIIYVLKLTNSKYYIGKTNDINTIINDHFNGNELEWTKIYKPEYILKQIPNRNNFTELAVTLKYMKMYGIDNVRGASYLSVKLKNSDKKEIQKHIRNEFNLCNLCGDSSHFSKDCVDNTKYSLFNKVKNFLKTFFYCKKYTEIIDFGKYKGYTYSEVLEGDKRYCEWVLLNDSDSPEFNRFKYWLNCKGFN